MEEVGKQGALWSMGISTHCAQNSTLLGVVGGGGGGRGGRSPVLLISYHRKGLNTFHLLLTSILVLRTSTWHLFSGIHIDGAFEIADALKKNNTLEVLRIGKNSFQSFGACLLLRGLRYNQTSALRELILDDVAFDR